MAAAWAGSARLLPPVLPDVYSLMVHHWKPYGKVKSRKHFHTLHWGIFAGHQLCEGSPTATTSVSGKSEDLFTQPTGSGAPGNCTSTSRTSSLQTDHRAVGKSSGSCRQRPRGRRAERQARSRSQAHRGSAGRLQGGQCPRPPGSPGRQG